MAPEIILYELGPTRSARARWALLEAGLPFESRGNEPSILHSDELKQIHPLGKLPAAIIDGQPLFESAAIATAIADLVPEKRLVAPSGTVERALHDQWVCFALSELDAWAWSAELNTLDFVFDEDRHVRDIVPQCETLYRRSLTALEAGLEGRSFLVDDRFSVTDIILSYSLHFGDEFGWLQGFPQVRRYLDRLFEQPNCTLRPHPT